VIVKKTRAELVKEILHDACLNSTFHGLPSAVKSDKKIVKVFWSLLFVFGIVSSVYCNEKYIY
jgi:hypothetical protein